MEVYRQTVSLYPFHPLPHWQIALECEIVRESDALTLRYRLSGNIEQVHMPSRDDGRCTKRLDGLWESTCFECFLQGLNCDSYHEVNVSPAGDWNLYRFTGYRAGMRPEQRVSSLYSKSKWSQERVGLDVTIPLAELELSGRAFRVGLSAVISCVDNQKSYWAAHHPGTKPDFHNEAGFIVDLPRP
ncbi:DOMON-like domain-containing protein [Desulfosediminicola ganghwensis]|uniref:DOMON-like domain-containing protein n=1 Tax=Desulfosediminicola ganghwensis TaxID=2569540 RepID=UPI001137EC26|nr:DOMON-like domain-containing protein [Desulfosediminicola ganghwensis]